MNTLPTELKLALFHLLAAESDDFKPCLALSRTTPAFHRVYVAHSKEFLYAHIRATLDIERLVYYRILILMRTEKRSTVEWQKDGEEDIRVHLEGLVEMKAAIIKIAGEDDWSALQCVEEEEVRQIVVARRMMCTIMRGLYARKIARDEGCGCEGTGDRSVMEEYEMKACASIIDGYETFRQLDTFKIVPGLMFLNYNPNWRPESMAIFEFHDCFANALAESRCMQLGTQRIRKQYGVDINASLAANTVLCKCSLKTLYHIYKYCCFQQAIVQPDSNPAEVELCCSIMPYFLISWFKARLLGTRGTMKSWRDQNLQNRRYFEFV